MTNYMMNKIESSLAANSNMRANLKDYQGKVPGSGLVGQGEQFQATDPLFKPLHNLSELKLISKSGKRRVSTVYSKTLFVIRGWVLGFFISQKKTKQGARKW